MRRRASHGLAVVLAVPVLAVGNCGGEPPATAGRVRSVTPDEVCVVADDVDLCFDPADVPGANEVVVDQCVTVRRAFESGRALAVADRPC